MNLDPFGDPFRLGGGLSTSDIFRRSRGGGARPRRPAEAAPEPEPEAVADDGAGEEEAKATEEEKGEKVTLSNPVWEVEDVGFNEETDISIEAVLPESQAHKTKVEFELFAKVPAGDDPTGGRESISKAQGNIEGGKARAKIPVYIPQYKDELGNLLTKVEYYFTAKHSASDLLEDDTVVKVVDHMAERLIKSHILQNVTFATDKSYIGPENAPALAAMVARIKEWREQHPDGKMAVFGHTDAVGKEDYNKKLSEKRARSIHAFLVKDASAWDALAKEEKWDRKAIPDFQAFMDEHNDLALADKDFDVIDGKPFAGCSEFNLVEKTQGECRANRRVAVFLLKSNKNFPIQYPCKQGSIAPCKKQVGRKGERRTAGFGCLFYDQLVVEIPEEVADTRKLIHEVAWASTQLIAWDASDDKTMKAKVTVKTENFTGAEEGTLQVFQFAKDGSHFEIASLDVKLEADKLYGADGKELEVKLEWHDTLYDHAKSQYFLTLKVGDAERSSLHTKEALLQLKHFDSCIADPSGDLSGAKDEGKWWAKHMEKKGPWMEATEEKRKDDGHKVDKIGVATTADMKGLVEKNKWIHHQSSHGTAYCMCDGNKNYVKKTATKGADGYLDYACPICNTFDQAVGCIFLKDWSNLFFDTDVDALERSPKALLLANCCLTAITDTYAETWVAKGTRWYIGWALPVGDLDAVLFAKAFYKRWLETYDMDPDKVGDAFSDVKGPYAKYRPRIFGS